MAHAAVHWAINEIEFPKEVKPAARWLLVHIADRADRDTWECWPSHKLLAKDAGMSARTVLDLMFVLEEAKLISRAAHFRPDGTRSSDRITLLSGYATIAGGDRNIQRDQPQHSTPERAKAAVQNLVTEPGKRTDIVLGAAEPFDAWWSAYPRKMAKVAARKAWKAASAKIGLDDLLELTRLFADHVLGKDPEHIAHPATWLNGERWNDELKSRGGQPDGNRRATGADRGADQHSARVEAMVNGARQALDRRRRWEVGG